MSGSRVGWYLPAPLVRPMVFDVADVPGQYHPGMLSERGGAEAEAIVPVTHAQHHAIEEANAELSSLLPGWRATAQGGAELAAAFERVRAVPIEHIHRDPETPLHARTPSEPGLRVLSLAPLAIHQR